MASLNPDTDWYDQMNSILSRVDERITVMKEKISSPGKFSKRGEVRERMHESVLDPPTLPLQTTHLQQPSPPSSSVVHWTDLAALQTQLKIQNQAIESLSQKLREMEREKESQKCHIQTLQEEVYRLREKEEMRQSPGVDRRTEQWRREVGHELSSLRGHISRAVLLGNPEESFGSKLCREEIENLQREVDSLKTRLRRHEEDAFHQQTETRRRFEDSFKTLDELTDNCRTQSSELVKTVSQYSQTKEEVRQIRAIVSELKEEVRCSARDRGPVSRQTFPSSSFHGIAEHPNHTCTLDLGASLLPQRHGGEVRVKEVASDSEDSSLTPSLAEVSSDDLSWLDDRDPALRPSQAGLKLFGSDLEEENADLLDNARDPDLSSDLDLDDL
ncbi:uncharacterized protein LOC130529153 isoform X1 [Takifugu flavidus]|uniref:uncharacterized protein LOC130529153 isoform X1 n=2 Tax=Takifugu flavidus TaxID=433684 RepID=UPI0025441449|nr:uncharacterized protein LOC130529153 isoform X1 [Takifugu flavidus]